MITNVTKTERKISTNFAKILSIKMNMYFIAPVWAGGLNKMKKIMKKEEGVSPVIATILMVAITVVLAATVYIMVAGMGTGGTNKMIASLSYDQQQSNPTSGPVYLRVSMSNPSSAAFNKVTVVLTPATGTGGKTTLNTSGGGTITIGTTTYTVNVQDLDGNGQLSDGDMLVISGGSLSGYTISISISGYSGNAQYTVPSS